MLKTYVIVVDDTKDRDIANRLDNVDSVEAYLKSLIKADNALAKRSIPKFIGLERWEEKTDLELRLIAERSHISFNDGYSSSSIDDAHLNVIKKALAMDEYVIVKGEMLMVGRDVVV